MDSLREGWDNSADMLEPPPEVIEATVTADGGGPMDCTATALPRLFSESMSQAFAENLRRFVRLLPPEAAAEVLADPMEGAGDIYHIGRDILIIILKFSYYLFQQVDIM